MARSERKITQFLEITGVTRTQAVQLLKATNWVVEDAIQLFFTVGPDGLRHHNEARIRDQPRELHDVPTFLSSFVGSFDAAKARAQSKGKWLLANIQADESESHELNRNVWRNDEIQEIIQKHYIFWQIYEHLEEGSKIMNWYKINKNPAVLILDPMTGYKQHHVEGSVDAQRMIEILNLYTEKGPLDGCIKRSEDGKTGGRIEYPALAREPATGAPGVVNVAFRLPYGSRVVRGFLATDPIQVLWSFASTQIKEDKDKEFELVSHTQGIKLNYDDQKSIEEAGVANSVLTLVLT